MNREQRRSMERSARSRGMSAKAAKDYVAVAENLEAIKHAGAGETSPPQKINDGDKVRLNIERIKARQNYPRMLDGYKQFVEESVGRVFTAHVEHSNMISLVENPSWVFWSGDLDKVEEAPAE